MNLRDLTTLDEFKQVVAVEKRVWGYDDGEDVVPVPILAVTVRRGAILIGAFDEQDRMAGFVYSIPAFKAGRVSQWSHMLGVIDEYRGSGIGRRLKLEQRLRAMEMGLELIEWTYDPLQALNASLNFQRLGVVVHEYEENIYGDSSSPLHRGTPTDRFVAEWWIRTDRVRDRITGTGDRQVRNVELGDAPSVTRTRSGEWLACDSFDLSLGGPCLTVEIPAGFGEMISRCRELALEWRYASRAIFTSYFARGYAVTDFLMDREHGRGRYLLEVRLEGNQPGGQASRRPAST